MASELHVDAIKHSGGTSALTIDSSGNLTASAKLHSVGSVIQLVKSTGGTQTSTTSTSFVATDISVNITPKFNNSLIRIDVQSVWWLHFGANAEEYFITTVYRDSTNIGSSSSSRVNQFRSGYVDSGNAYNYNNGFTIFTFDTPNTTSQVTYKLYVRSGAGLEVRYSDTNSENTITAMEIAQ